jgi:hypothetical protein
MRKMPTPFLPHADEKRECSREAEADHLESVILCIPASRGSLRKSLIQIRCRETQVLGVRLLNQMYRQRFWEIDYFKWGIVTHSSLIFKRVLLFAGEKNLVFDKNSVLGKGLVR